MLYILMLYILIGYWYL